MSKYDFIKQGNLLFWHTADNDIECRIISTPEKVDSDSIILISTSSSETEVLASELLPIGSSRSHKEEFMRWKKEREAEGMEFFSRLSEVMETDSDLAVGDMVAFTNDYGVVFGTAVSRQHWCVRFPNMPQPLVQRWLPIQKGIMTPPASLSATASSFTSATLPVCHEWAAA